MSNMNTNNITIASSAMLVDLTIRGYTGRKQDKAVSDEVAGAKQAKSRAGTYQKNLFANCKELASIQGYDQMIRAWHAARTLPWSDHGPRLLPTKGYFDYMRELAQHENIRTALVDEFEKEYKTIIQSAQFELGALFNVDDYPDVSEIRHRFQMHYNIYPLPEAGDFRVDIGNEGLEELRKNFEEAQERRIADAMQDVRDRVKDAVSKLSNQLRIEPDGTKGKVYESTVEACIELCDAMGDLNLTGDPEIEQMRRELRNTVEYCDAKDLRKDEGSRMQTKKELDHLLEKFSLT